MVMSDDTFRDLSPAEVQAAVLQFIGQNLGELKSLDKHLIEKNNTLRGMTINPREVLQTLPAVQSTTPPQLPPQQVPLQIQPQSPLENVSTHQDLNDPNQLEFNFDSSPYSKSIFEQLTEINQKLSTIIQIVSNKPVTQKKKVPSE